MKKIFLFLFVFASVAAVAQNRSIGYPNVKDTMRGTEVILQTPPNYTIASPNAVLTKKIIDSLLALVGSSDPIVDSIKGAPGTAFTNRLTDILKRTTTTAGNQIVLDERFTYTASDLNGHTPSNTGSSSWVKEASAPVYTSAYSSGANGVASTTDNTKDGIYRILSGAGINNQVSGVVVTDVSGYNRFIVRFTDDGNYIYTEITSTTLTLKQMLAYTPTTIASASISVASGDTIQMATNGTAVVVSKNGTAAITNTYNSALVTGAYIGFYVYNTTGFKFKALYTKDLTITTGGTSYKWDFPVDGSTITYSGGVLSAPGGGTVNLTKSRTATQTTVLPSGGGTSVALDSADLTNSGIMTANQWAMVKYAPRVFNVQRYGAVGDSTTNCTTAFASAIAAAYAAGGGQIFIPDGFYRVDSIRFPMVLGAVQSMAIDVVGEHGPLYFFGTVGVSDMPHKCAVIISNSTVAGSVIKVDPSPGPDFSTINISISNLEIRTYNNPSIGGIDVFYAAFVPYLKNLWINTGVYNPNASQPTHSGAIGIKTPAVNNGALTNMDNITVSGYYTGIEDNEHTYGGSVNVLSCLNGINFNSGGHASHYNRLGMYRNKYNLVVSGARYFSIDQLNIEHADSATQTDVNNRWQITWADVYDPSNLGAGDLSWNVVHGNVGNDHVFTKVGGTGIQTREIGSASSGGGLSGGTAPQLAVWSGSTSIAPTGLNTTGPSAALGGAQLQSINADNFIWGNNTYFDGTDYVAKTTGTSESINLGGGGMYFNTNTSQTAGSRLGTNAITPLKADNTGAVELGNHPGTPIKVMTVDPTNGIRIFSTDMPFGTLGSDSMLAIRTTSGISRLYKTVAAGIPGGSTSYVQYNNGGSFAGSSNLVWDNTNARLGIGNNSPAATLDILKSVNGDLVAKIKNSNAGSSAAGYFNIENDAGSGLQFGIYSSTHGNYGNLLGGEPWFYSAQGLHFMVDNTGKAFDVNTGTTGSTTTKLSIDGTGTKINIGSDATGDLPYRNSSGYLARLGIGSNGNVLGIASGLPSWLTPTGTGSPVFSASPALTSIPTAPTAAIGTNTTQIATMEAVYAAAGHLQTAISSGSPVTLGQVRDNMVTIDPSSLISSLTVTTPASPVDGDVFTIAAGGTIAVGSTVVTTFTLTANSGQTVYGTITSPLLGGDVMRFQYDSLHTRWFRVK